MKRLSQVLAIEKQIKTKANEQGGVVHKALQKPDLFFGHQRTFEPLNEDSESLEPDNKPVVSDALLALKRFLSLQGDLLDVTLTKDDGNTKVRGTLMLGDAKFDVPVTFLIWLEKQLLDLKTVVESVPVLPSDKQWMLDETSGQYVTKPVKTARNKKKKVPLVLAPATDKHPAQVQVIEEDVLQGYWSAVYVSTAMPGPAKMALADRVEALLKAVKEAREEANSNRVEELVFSTALRAYLQV